MNAQSRVLDSNGIRPRSIAALPPRVLSDPRDVLIGNGLLEAAESGELEAVFVGYPGDLFHLLHRDILAQSEALISGLRGPASWSRLMHA